MASTPLGDVPWLRDLVLGEWPDGQRYAIGIDHAAPGSGRSAVLVFERRADGVFHLVAEVV